MRVIVPFGKGTVAAKVLFFLDAGYKFERMKSILTLWTKSLVMDDQSIRLQFGCSDRCLYALYDAIRRFASGLWFSLQDTYRIKENINKEEAYLAAAENVGCTRLLDFLYSSGGCAELRQIQAALGDFDFSSSLKYLIKQEILTVDTTAVRGVGDKLIEFASLAVPVEEALAVTSPRKKARRLACRRCIFSFFRNGFGSGTLFYTGASRVPSLACQKRAPALKRRYSAPVVRALLPQTIVLTKAQQAVFYRSWICFRGRTRPQLSIRRSAA